MGEGAMAAILALDLAAVEEACRDAAEGQVVAPANINGPGQVVIAGHTAAVERAMAACKAAGRSGRCALRRLRAVPLRVDDAGPGAPGRPTWPGRRSAILRAPGQQRAGAAGAHRGPRRVKAWSARYRRPCRWQECAETLGGRASTPSWRWGLAPCSPAC